MVVVLCSSGMAGDIVHRLPGEYSVCVELSGIEFATQRTKPIAYCDVRGRAGEVHFSSIILI